MKLDTATVAEQEALLAELKTQIEAEQLLVNALEERVTEGKTVKKHEEERHRHVQQQFTALSAKKEFIETHYDYTSNVADMNLETFKNIVASNTEVNSTVEGFVNQVSAVKKEVTTILASRYTF